jgi:allantoinase
MCEGPARLAGLERTKGRIAAGFDADFVVWNPEARGRVEPSRLYHRHKVTPYAGCALQGVVERVYLRGLKVSENGVVFAEPNGKMLRRAV